MSKSIKPEVVSPNDRVFKRMKVLDPRKLRYISAGSLFGIGLGSVIGLPWWVGIILMGFGFFTAWKQNLFIE